MRCSLLLFVTVIAACGSSIKPPSSGGSSADGDNSSNGVAGNANNGNSTTGGATNNANAPVVAQWASTPLPAAMESFFYSVAVDSSGNIYAAGEFWGVGELNFDNNVTVKGTYNGDNVLLVKFDSSGTALWAQTFSGNANYSSCFRSVAVDSGGNVYAAGGVSSASGTTSVGTGITITDSNGTFNAVLVKYDSSGVPQWAKTVISGPDTSNFSSLAVDATGNVYAAGSIGGGGTYDFGNSVTVTSTAVAYSSVQPASNLVLVKYNASGVTQWAQTVTSGLGPSGFGAVTVDSNDNVYAAGSIAGAQNYDFGNGITAASTFIRGGPTAGIEFGSALLMKYSSAGLAQWATTVVSGAEDSSFNALAMDSTGSIYAAGTSMGTQTFDFGNGATTKGTPDPNKFYGLASPEFFILVKYSASGTAAWAQTVSDVGSSGLTSVVIDSSDNAFVAGNQLVECDSSGMIQWVSSPTDSDNAPYVGVALDSANNVYAAGAISGTIDFGNAVTATGTNAGAGSGWTALLVKYQSVAR